MKYKTIRIYESDFDEMNTLCNKYSVTKTELVEACMFYFTKTGIDPRDPSDVTSEVKKLKNQLISFIRTQEKEKLNPLVKKQNLLIDKFLDHLENDGVNKDFLVKVATQLGSEIVKKLGQKDVH